MSFTGEQVNCCISIWWITILSKKEQTIDTCNNLGGYHGYCVKWGKKKSPNVTCYMNLRKEFISVVSRG